MRFALLGCLLMALSTPVAAFAGAVALGLCYGSVNPASTHIPARVTPERFRPVYFSIKQAGMPMGAALAGLLLPLIVAAYDWRIAMIATGLVAVVVAVIIQPLRKSLDAVRHPN
jgi:MFS family permease